jgi:hypothetical protein
MLESAGAQLTVSCGVSGERPFMAIRDQKDHCLSWGLEGAEAVKPEALKEEIKEEDHVVQAFRQAMADAQGTVRYSEIFPGVDMICRNDSRFKDEFIFSAPESVCPVIFRLETEGLKLSRDEESGLVVFDTDSEKIYNIPAPVRASIIGNMKVKQQTVRGRVEIFRLYGCRKILPDLDRDDLKIIGIGSMNRIGHRTLITSHPSKVAIPDWENAYPDKS